MESCSCKLVKKPQLIKFPLIAAYMAYFTHLEKTISEGITSYG